MKKSNYSIPLAVRISSTHLGILKINEGINSWFTAHHSSLRTFSKDLQILRLVFSIVNLSVLYVSKSSFSTPGAVSYNLLLMTDKRTVIREKGPVFCRPPPCRILAMASHLWDITIHTIYIWSTFCWLGLSCSKIAI